METTRKSSSFALSEEMGLELCRVLGLAINNISMYGIEHSVTATSVAGAYDELLDKLDVYGEIEFILSDSGLIINGTVIQTERTSGQIFATQITKLGVHDFAINAPLDRTEFNEFISILAAAPGSKVVADGFEAAVTKACFKAIRVTNASYARVDKNADLDKINFKDASVESSSGKDKDSGGSKSFDLDTGGGTNTFELDMGSGSNAFDLDVGGDSGSFDIDMGLGEMGFASSSGEAVEKNSITADAQNFIKEKRSAEELQQKLIKKIRETRLSPEERKVIRTQLFDGGFSQDDWDDLLLASGDAKPNDSTNSGAEETLDRIRRDLDTLAAHGATIAGGKSNHAMSGIIESIDKKISALAQQTKEHATTLVGKVDADRETIAQVEKDARARGIGLNLSRDELLESFAEINQELSQSLTVVTSVTDILSGENMGSINQAQKDILKVAADGVARINKLVSYMGNISGVPAGFTPDRKILDEAYGV